MAWQDTLADLRDNWFGDVIVGLIVIAAGFNHIQSPAESLFGRIFGMFTQVTGTFVQSLVVILGVIVILFGLTEWMEAYDKIV